ncbi:MULTISPECIES: MFS transporter [Paenibacillus]|uniref:MFS transporter n=1 Tax=Paenibacillus TaxID=44249 RepID=UPI0010B7EC25|nr:MULTISPECIES: MFS transporter [Paenibacillus]NTZ18033.1 MFS transporter [Paenibacillus sp. JMULE4]GCL73112.1 MFS transporter [Paenibacillus naphthalenovorans]
MLESWKRTLIILWIGVLFCSSSYTMAVPFLPLFLFDLGVEQGNVHLWAGVIYSSSFLVGAVMAPFWGSMADKYGKRRMVIRAGFSLAIVYALFALVTNPWELMGARLLHGFVGGFVPASMAIVASSVPENKMGFSLGLMQAGTMTGGIIGPLFGGLLANWFGMRMSFVVSASIIFLATVAVLIWIKETGKAAPGESVKLADSFRMAVRNRTFLQLLSVLVVFQLCINMIQPMLALHIADLQGNLQGTVLTSGIIFSLIGIAGIIASPYWGKVGEKYGYRTVLHLGLIIGGGVVCLQYFVQQLWLFTVIQFLFGLFIAAVVPSVNTLAVRSTDPDFRGRSFGFTQSANQLGSMIGPLLGGGMGMFVNIHWIFVATGMILIVFGTMLAVRFHMVPSMSGSAMTLDKWKWKTERKSG